MDKEDGLINTVCSIYVCYYNDACSICMKNTKFKNLVESCTKILFFSESIIEDLRKVHC